MKTEILTITEEMAKDYLKGNVNNRSLRRHGVSYLCEQILSGNWACTGQPIIFDEYGNLMDGQHRLYALLKACEEKKGCTIKCMVVYGSEKQNFTKLDNGIRRGPQDALRALGFRECNPISSAVIKLHSYRKYGNIISSRNMGGRPSTEDVVDMATELKEELYESVVVTRNLCKSKLLKKSLALPIHLLLARVDKVKADEFMTRITDGIGLSGSSQILVLRNRLILDATDRRVSKKSTQDHVVVSWCINAWNAWMVGKVIKVLRTISSINDVPDIYGLTNKHFYTEVEKKGIVKYR